ncbi:MAG: histidine kinase [Pseudomonadales bacterium]|nr:histidine kinase [Pseudomonadales bacterium]
MKPGPTPHNYVIPDLGRIEAVATLVFLSLLTVFVLVIYKSGYTHFNWPLMALASLFVTWVVLCCAAALQLLRRWMLTLPQNWVIRLSYFTMMLILLSISGISDWLIQHWSIDPYQPSWSWAIENQIIGAVIAAAVMRYFVLQNELHRRKHAELNARIDALQSRIRPHFLFNSMNTIASLIPDDPKLAEQVVEDMSELFRANLMESRQLVSLNEEFELCRRYLDIETIRLGTRLTVQWQLGLIPDNAKIPLLTLQPLFENAVYHGIQPLVEGGTVQIQLHHKKPFIDIVIKNPLPGDQTPGLLKAHSTGHHMALDNIRNRLDAVFGNNAFMTNGLEKQLYVVRLQIPDGS